MTEVFLDTSFAIALSSVTDHNHQRAVNLANQIQTNKICLVMLYLSIRLPIYYLKFQEIPLFG